jgi:hypothetical protein|tara:strand:+ start:12 stop:224 length:213 start_codon:yes stop_codon:yes gene_type:complete
MNMDEIDLAMEKLDPLYEERHRLESTMIEEAEAGNFEMVASMQASLSYIMPEINRLEDTLERDHVVLRFA